MRYAAKKDTVHAAIVQRLRDLHWLVLDTSAYPGFVDAVAYKSTRFDCDSWHDTVRLLEFKTGKGKLTKGQQALVDARWPIVVLRSVEDAEALR